MYTPLAQTYLFAPNHAIAFIGTADPWSDINEVTQLSAQNNIPLVICEGCNHSLECNDAMKNIEILKDVMQRTSFFISGVNM